MLAKNTHDKYRKNRKNSKCNKIPDLESKEAKKGPEMSAKIAKIAKVTRNFLATIGDKSIETLHLSPLHSKLGCLLFLLVARTGAHGIARRGWGRKAMFPPFEVNKP